MFDDLAGALDNHRLRHRRATSGRSCGREALRAAYRAQNAKGDR